MLLQLFTAGVLLTSVFAAWAFTAPGISKARVMLKTSAVWLRGKSPAVVEVFDFAFSGVFASARAIAHLVHAPHCARVEDVRRVLARPLSNKAHLGFYGYPPYLR
jgi:hypothetical protein